MEKTTRKITLLQVPPDGKDPVLIGLDQLLTNLPFEECQRQIEHIITIAASMNDQGTVLKWLNMYRTAINNASLNAPDQLGQKYEHITSFRVFLKSLYWLLPKDVIQQSAAISQFLASKEFILKELIEAWNPDLSPSSLDIFRFLIAAHGTFNGPTPLPEESIWERNARNRFVTGETQKMALDTIRDWIPKRGFNAWSLEQWIVQPGVPSEIIKLLAHAWVRVAHGDIVVRHLKRSLLFSKFTTSIEESPREAQQAMREWGEALYQKAKNVEMLMSWIQSSFGSDADVSYAYRTPEEIEVVIINNRKQTDATNYALACSGLGVVQKSREKLRIQNLSIRFVVKSRDGDGEDYTYTSTGKT